MENISTFAAVNGRVLKGAGVISDVSVITEGEAKGHNVFIGAAGPVQIQQVD